jgi:hypothetical protein
MATISWWSAGLLCVAVLSVVALWIMAGSGGPGASARLDAIRTAASIVVGTGGAAALLLAARRQRATELDLEQKDHDATERRVTELYGKAADQLGSERAPVRLAGLYALERLAQGNARHRQTIVNLICAYLRMPFEPPPGETAPAVAPRRRPRTLRPRQRPASPAEGPSRQDDPLQELEVRRTAQNLLTTHLSPGDADQPAPTYWADMDLNLTGATLVKFTMTHCVVRSALFTRARFAGPATFRGSTFEFTVDFRHSRFTAPVDFRNVGFGTNAGMFHHCVFENGVNFGVHTTPNLTGALAKLGRTGPRKWPRGWTVSDRTDSFSLAALVPSEHI